MHATSLVDLLALPYFGALQDAQAYLMSFPAPILESAISPILFSCLLSILVLSTILYLINRYEALSFFAYNKEEVGSRHNKISSKDADT